MDFLNGVRIKICIKDGVSDFIKQGKNTRKKGDFSGKLLE